MSPQSLLEQFNLANHLDPINNINYLPNRVKSFCLPSGCFICGVMALRKSSGVMKTSVLLSSSKTRTVAKYRKILSGVENALILFSYSMIYIYTISQFNCSQLLSTENKSTLPFDPWIRSCPFGTSFWFVLLPDHRPRNRFPPLCPFPLLSLVSVSHWFLLEHFDPHQRRQEGRQSPLIWKGDVGLY